MPSLPAWILTSYTPPRHLAVAEWFSFGIALVVVAGSAVVTKELAARHNAPALAAVDGTAEPAEIEAGVDELEIVDPLDFVRPTLSPEASPASSADDRFAEDVELRWFNGRPVRPARTVWMTVTAYSPDERSCAGTADGITASLHRVETNAHRLVAADTRILPLGSKISIPGYDRGQIVPVLDRGGKIKGHRLDVLFPTHEQARDWGVKRLPVVVWEYADGLGPENWRRIRDSRR